MEKLEKIRTEYMLFEEEKTAGMSSECVNALLEYCRGEMDYSMKTSNNSIRRNNIDYKIERLKSVVGRIFGYEVSCDWVLEDTNHLTGQVSLASEFDGYFGRLSDILNDDNYLEVSKLTQFTLDRYLKNYNYIESLRNGVNLAASGINYCGSGEDDTLDFSIFFKETIDSIKENSKVLKKVEE